MEFIGRLIFVYPHIAVVTNTCIQKAQVQQFKTKKQSLPPKQISNQLETAEKCNEATFENKGKFTIHLLRDLTTIILKSVSKYHRKASILPLL